MAPTVEETPARIYCIQLKSVKETIRVRGETICKPSKDDPVYKVKRDGNIVGEFSADDVAGWWIDVPRMGDPGVSFA